jgi:cytochrome P450
MSDLCEKLKEYKKNDKIVPVQWMWSAFACDVITEYAFGLNYNQLDSKDFGDTLHDAYTAASEFGHVALQFPWIAKFLNSLPDSWVQAMNPSLKKLLQLKHDLTGIVSRISQEHDKEKKPEKPTIFLEVMQSNIAAQEKSIRRLADEAQTIVVGGLTTTAWALTVAMYYLLENPQVLEKLRAELFASVPDHCAPRVLSFQKLEPLPYLRGCIR